MIEAAEKPVLDLPPAQRALVLVSIIVTAIMLNAAAFTVTTILPQMQGAFAATQDEIAWVMTFALLATAITLPLVGWLVPRFGRRRVMLVSIATFTLSTMFCGLAQSLEALVFWRIVQGAASAALMPLGQLILLDAYPRSRHALVISLFGAANTVGPILGPLAGGWLAENYSWRWGFHMLVPFGIIAGLMTHAVLPHSSKNEANRFDWLGFGTLSIAIACFQYVLSRGERVDWFQSQEIVVVTMVAAFSFYLFLAHALTSNAPFIDLSLLLDRNYGIGTVLIILFGMVSFAPMVILPPLMQVQMGFPDTDVGWMISWRGLGVTAGFGLCILLSRIDARILVAVGFLSQVWSGLWMMRFELGTPLFDLCAVAFLQGLAVGLVWAPISTIAFRTILPAKRPEAMALFHLTRSVATSLYIAAAVAEIVRGTGTNYSRLSEQISLLNKTLLLPETLGGWSIDTTAGLASIAKEIGRQATMIGYLNSFWTYTVVAALAVPLVVFISNERRSDPAR